jgi:hypothetical protein
MNRNEDMAMQAGGMAMMACDARLKKNIEPISAADVAELKSVVKPYRFLYKDDAFGKGEFIGPMAQELEQSKLGRTVVEEDEAGNKIVNFSKLLMLLCCAEAA